MAARKIIIRPRAVVAVLQPLYLQQTQHYWQSLLAAAVLRLITVQVLMLLVVLKIMILQAVKEVVDQKMAHNGPTGHFQ
jgi:hypothetical protein